MRLELTGQAIILTTAVFASLAVRDAGLAGLALTSALNMVGLLNWATRMGSELEMGMNSVERMSEYLTYASEAPAVVEGNRCRPRSCFTRVLPVLYILLNPVVTNPLGLLFRCDIREYVLIIVE